jgi:hypothetical protein
VGHEKSTLKNNTAAAAAVSNCLSSVYINQQQAGRKLIFGLF